MDNVQNNSEAFFESLSDEFSEVMHRGQKAPKIVTCAVEEVLLPEHIRSYLELEGKLDSTVKVAEKDVRVLRARHHSVARLIAQSVPEGIIAEFTGYTPGYISVLKQSPAMVELVEHYRRAPNAAALQIGEKLREVGTAALERIAERIERDEMDDHALLGAAKLGMDRSGHGPQSQVHQISEQRIIDVAELQRLHLEARQRDAARIVHPEDVRKALPKPDGGGTDNS